MTDKRYLAVEVRASALQDETGTIGGFQINFYGLYGVPDEVMKEMYNQMRVAGIKVLTEAGFIDPEGVSIELPVVPKDQPIQ